MTDPISSIGQVGAGQSAAPTGTAKTGHKLPFADLVNDLLTNANGQQAEVKESVNQLVTGETDSIHDVVLTAAQADLAFRLVMEVRDRLISSYQEIMRMQM